MKINLAVRRGYKIEYESVIEDVKKIKSYCEKMEDKAHNLNKSVPSCHEEIISKNYEKTREITGAMLKKIANAEFELAELLASCEAFADKVERTKNIRFPM